MKLFCLTTGKEVAVGDKLKAVSGVVVGYEVEVIKITPPSGEYRKGAVKYNVIERGVIKQYMPPNVIDCIFIQNDSLITSVTYDNEKSLKDTITEILLKFLADKREVRKILIGYREWDQISQLKHGHTIVPSKGKVPPHKFLGILTERIPHREQCLAFEHGPMRNES